MFILSQNDFYVRDVDRLLPFVKCWECYYRDSTKLPNSDDEIDYFSELNLGDNLTEQNLIRLLRWKDPRMLTHPKKRKMARKCLIHEFSASFMK